MKKKHITSTNQIIFHLSRTKVAICWFIFNDLKINFTSLSQEVLQFFPIIILGCEHQQRFSIRSNVIFLGRIQVESGDESRDCVSWEQITHIWRGRKSWNQRERDKNDVKNNQFNLFNTCNLWCSSKRMSCQKFNALSWSESIIYNIIKLKELFSSYYTWFLVGLTSSRVIVCCLSVWKHCLDIGCWAWSYGDSSIVTQCWSHC